MRYLIFVPSNQDSNYYPDKTTEQYRMNALAQMCADYCNDIPDLTAFVVTGKPQSDMVGLQALYEQLNTARSALDAVNADPRQTAIINMHSDSGAWRHVLGIYGGGVGSSSYKLAVATSSRLEKTMLTGDLRFWDYTGYAFYSLRGKYNTCLIECGSHQNTDDVEFLINRTPMIAEALVKGALSYLGGPVDKEVVQGMPEVYFSTFNVPCNSDSAIYKYWKLSYDNDYSNMGPAISGEEPGDKYGEPNTVVQKFINTVVVSKPEEGWKCYRGDTVMNPQKWFGLGA